MHTPQQFNDSLLPVHSGMVTVEAAARLPRQNITQTREDMLEAAERLTNAYVLGRGEPPGRGNPVDPFDLLPAVTVDAVVVQATEIARQRQVDTGRIQPHERVAPLTEGAFYKALAKDRGTQSGSRKRILGVFRLLVAQRLIDGFEPGNLFAGSIEALEQGEDLTPSLRLGFEAECEQRLYNPSYIFLGAVAALEGRNPNLQPRVQAAYARDVAATTASLRQVLTISDRNVRPGLSIEHFSFTLVSLIRGVVGRARRAITSEPAMANPECWQPAGLGALAIFDSFTIAMKKQGQ